MTNRFINNIYSIIRYGNGNKERTQKCSESERRFRTGTSKENSRSIDSKKRTSRPRSSRTTSSKESSSRSKDCRRDIQSSKAFCVESRKDSQGSKSLYWQAWAKAEGIKSFSFSFFYKVFMTLMYLDFIDESPIYLYLIKELWTK